MISSNRFKLTVLISASLIIISSCDSGKQSLSETKKTAANEFLSGESWLAGDHHVHSRFSVGWDEETDPPTPIMGGDAIYPIPMNAAMGRRFGLDWIVTTDHGGPNHSKIRLEHAYPELIESRKAIPEIIQYMGMEFDTPGADHSSIIMPLGEKEAINLFEVETKFNKKEPWPEDKNRDTEERMIDALKAMKKLSDKPIVIAHHPSRSARGNREYGMTEPAELRSWNDAAPEIAVGMEGAPGHQAISQIRNRFNQPSNHSKFLGNARPRGFYGRLLGGYPTMGGFDQMTAQVGGFWDSMLGEGRRWWITANSDSHIHWTDGGVDFWPGEYSKTYVLAEKNSAAVIESIRNGKMFVTTGDLVSEVWFEASNSKPNKGFDSAVETASIGSTLKPQPGQDVTIKIKILDPGTPNHNGDHPEVSRVDLIFGEFFEDEVSSETDLNPSAKVVRRWKRTDMEAKDNYLIVNYTIKNVANSFYVRLRGTNTEEMEPVEDVDNENPWADLWFYTNPIFVEIDN